jgi:hypothetical protein
MTVKPTGQITEENAAQITRSGASTTGNRATGLPIISAGRHAFIWPIDRLIRVPSIVGVYGTRTACPAYFSLSHKRILTKTISTQAPAGFT